MTGTLTLIHTAYVHSHTFDALRDRIAPDTVLVHQVRTDWLLGAQKGITPFLAKEISEAVSEIDGTVVCTCTTIGPIAEAAGAIRIDRPMMQAAAKIPGPVLMAYCLDSTREPSLSLLESEMEQVGNTAPIHPFSLSHLWPLFEAGKSAEFTAGIAKGIRIAVQDIPGLAAVVLAQASMASAKPLLAELPIPVLSSPELALRAGLARL